MKKIYVLEVPTSTEERPILEKLVKKYKGIGLSVSGEIDGIFISNSKIRGSRSHEILYVGDYRLPKLVPFVMVECKAEKNKIRRVVEFAESKKRNISLILYNRARKKALVFVKGKRNTIARIVDGINQLAPVEITRYVFNEFGELEKVLYS